MRRRLRRRLAHQRPRWVAGGGRKRGVGSGCLLSCLLLSWPLASLLPLACQPIALPAAPAAPPVTYRPLPTAAGYLYDPLDSFAFFRTDGAGAYGSRSNVTLQVGAETGRVVKGCCCAYLRARCWRPLHCLVSTASSHLCPPLPDGFFLAFFPVKLCRTAWWPARRLTTARALSSTRCWPSASSSASSAPHTTSGEHAGRGSSGAVEQCPGRQRWWGTAAGSCLGLARLPAPIPPDDSPIHPPLPLQLPLPAFACPALPCSWGEEVVCSSKNDRGGVFSFPCGHWKSYYRLDMDLGAACGNVT